MIVIRAMIPEDVVQVSDMEKQYFSMPWSRQALMEAVTGKQTLYMVAAEGEEVLAYCGMYCILDEGSINQVAVRADKRGLGIGKRLLQEFMQKGWEIGIRSYTLEVRVGNLSAIGLYESCGFVKEAVRKDFYQSPKEDAYIMWKR